MILTLMNSKWSMALVAQAAAIRRCHQPAHRAVARVAKVARTRTHAARVRTVAVRAVVVRVARARMAAARAVAAGKIPGQYAVA